MNAGRAGIDGRLPSRLERGPAYDGAAASRTDEPDRG